MPQPIFGQPEFAGEQVTATLNARSAVTATATVSQATRFATADLVAGSSAVATAAVRRAVSTSPSSSSGVAATALARRVAIASPSSSSGVMATALVRHAAAASLSSSSGVAATALVLLDTRKSGRSFENDPSNLTGTYAIVMPRFGGKRRFRFVEIEFTYEANKYQDAFYTEKEVAVAMSGMRGTPGMGQKVLLDKFEGTVAWKK